MLQNAKQMIEKAFAKGYAVPHININNLEWTKAILTTAQELRSPIILGTSGGAIKYMGGFKTILGMVEGLLSDLKITVPVTLHLDHGSYDMAVEALESGYPSVMFDGSHLPFAENKQKTLQIIKLAKSFNATVECEVGTLSGDEDGVVGSGEVASKEEVEQIASLGPEMIAAGINNIHGPYPKNWTGLRFDVLSKLKDAGKTALVLHGGSGIPEEQVKKAITMGVAKVNVNTELQLANAKEIKEFVISGQIDEGNNYDPRKILAPSYAALKKVVAEKIELFDSKGKA